MDNVWRNEEGKTAAELWEEDTAEVEEKWEMVKGLLTFDIKEEE